VDEVIMKIVSFKAFGPAFSIMFERDKETAENIMSSIKAILRDTHSVLMNCSSSNAQLQIALLKEKIAVQELAQQYRSISHRLEKRKQSLMEKANLINESFFDQIFDRLDNYYNQKKKLLCNKAEWELPVKELDDRILLEKILKKELDANQIRADLTLILEEVFEGYKLQWIREIENIRIDLPMLCGTNIGNIGEISRAGQSEAAEQMLFIGLGTSASGIPGLASGWHTLSYAVKNGLPPIAVHTAFVTAMTGSSIEEISIKNRRDQLEEIINQYHRTLVMHLETVKFKELENQTLRKYMMQFSSDLIKSTNIQLEGMALGQLSKEDLSRLDRAFHRHLLLIEEALKQ
jgi:hypothetical protein